MKKTFISGLAVAALTIFCACGSKGSGDKTSESAAENAAFAENQPVESGIYDASAYQITGANEREGKFDGRVIVALSPERSALYVYENGNRAKINYSIVLDRPFEKGDSGIYRSADTKGSPVVITVDSIYSLTFGKKSQKVKIDFDKSPRTTGSAVEMLERMNEQLKNKKD